MPPQEDLEAVTTEDLIEELRNRSDSFLCLLGNERDLQGARQRLHHFSKGNIWQVLGMACYSVVHTIRRMLEGTEEEREEEI